MSAERRPREKKEKKEGREAKEGKHKDKARHKESSSSHRREKEEGRSASSHSPSSASSSSGPPGSPSNALSAKKFRALLEAEMAPQQGRRRAMSVGEGTAPPMLGDAGAKKDVINGSSLRSSAADPSPPRSRSSSRERSKERRSDSREKERDSDKDRDGERVRGNHHKHKKEKDKKKHARPSPSHSGLSSSSSTSQRSSPAHRRAAGSRSPVRVRVSKSTDSDDELLSSDSDAPPSSSSSHTPGPSPAHAPLLAPPTSSTSTPVPSLPTVTQGRSAPKSVRIAPDAKATDAPSRVGDGPVLLWLYWTPRPARSVFVATSLDGEKTLYPVPFRPSLGVHAAALLVPPGRVSYRFLVDFAWTHDPQQPTMAAPGGGLLNWRQASAVHTVNAEFRWPRGSEKSVAVLGAWNDWTPVALVQHTTHWSVSAPLPPGLHLFKFMVDGAWRTDPSAPHCRSLEGHLNNWRII